MRWPGASASWASISPTGSRACVVRSPLFRRRGQKVPMSAEPSDDGELLDAYSHTLTQVAAALAPSVAAVQVTSSGGRSPLGSGSAGALSSAGCLVPSPHVVAGGDGGRLDLADGRRLRFRVRGCDPLSDLAVLVAEH